MVGLRTRPGGRRGGAGEEPSGVVAPTATATATARLSAVWSWVLIAAMGVVAHPVAVVVGMVLIGVVLFVPDVPNRELLVMPIAGTVFNVLGAAARRNRPPGRVVRPAEEPELAALVRGVAAQLDFHAPLLVRVLPVPEVGLVPVKVSNQRGYALVLGWPLLRRLTAVQLTAVVAHEIAYQQNLLSRRDRMLGVTRGMVEASLDNRIRAPRAVSGWLLRATQEYLWRAEIVADARSVEVVGTAAVLGALWQVPVITTTFEHFVDDWVSVLAEDGCYPEDLYDALDAALDDPHVVRRTLAAVADDETVDLYSAASHPPLPVRRVALPEGVSAGRDDSRPVLLRQADNVQRWCLRELFPAGREDLKVDKEDGADSAEGVGAGSEGLRPTRVLDTSPERFDIAVDAGAELMRATGQDSISSAVATAVDALAEGSWPRLARAIEPGVGSAPPPLRATAVRDVMVGCLAHTISGLLRDAGWESASRWLTTVLLDPDGAVVDVRELIEQAVDSGDPAAVRALLGAATPRAAA